MKVLALSGNLLRKRGNETKPSQREMDLFNVSFSLRHTSMTHAKKERRCHINSIPLQNLNCVRLARTHILFFPTVP